MTRSPYKTMVGAGGFEPCDLWFRSPVEEWGKRSAGGGLRGFEQNLNHKSNPNFRLYSTNLDTQRPENLVNPTPPTSPLLYEALRLQGDPEVLYEN